MSQFGVSEMTHFRTIILIAKNNGWLHIDPFANYKFAFEKKERGFLTESELELIKNKQFSTNRLEKVRDIFLFSCYTGLAYIDVKNLTMNNIRESFDKKLWIIGKREKTNVTLGVSIESVSKMLGHTNIKTTQIYAKITDNKISDDMAMLANKLNEKKIQPKSNLDISFECLVM